MQYSFLVFIILVFGALLFLNFYFRVRILGCYKRLVQAKVEFGSEHIFNTRKLEAEILPKYPAQRDDILMFCKYIRFTMRMASVFAVLITAYGMVLLYYR